MEEGTERKRLLREGEDGIRRRGRRKGTIPQLWTEIDAYARP